MCLEANKPMRKSPFTVHFCVSQFGSQLLFMNRDKLPFGPASIILNKHSYIHCNNKLIHSFNSKCSMLNHATTYVCSAMTMPQWQQRCKRTCQVCYINTKDLSHPVLPNRIHVSIWCHKHGMQCFEANVLINATTSTSNFNN